MFKNKLIYQKETRIWLLDAVKNRLLLPNETEKIRPTFRDGETFLKWQECCRQAVRCCENAAIYQPKTTDSFGELVDEEPRTWCPPTWDGLDCWPSTEAGSVSVHKCPHYIYFLDFEPACSGTASKVCFPNGSWYVRNDHEWTDFGRCAPKDVSESPLVSPNFRHLAHARWVNTLACWMSMAQLAIRA